MKRILKLFPGHMRRATWMQDQILFSAASSERVSNAEIESDSGDTLTTCRVIRSQFDVDRLVGCRFDELDTSEQNCLMCVDAEMLLRLQSLIR